MARTSAELTSTEIAILESLDPLGAPGTVPTVNAGGDGFDYSTPAGGGDVTKVGTPVNNQVGVWTGDGTIEGDSALTFDTSTDTLTSGTFNSTALTASELTATDASKNIVSLPVATYPSLTETSYVKGVTSAIQTQLNGKQASLGFTAENSANKSTTLDTDKASDTKYPSVKSVYDWATGLFSSKALDNLASVAINTSLVSDTDNTDDLGTTVKKWANLFVTTIGDTATRVTKGWFTDIESTNMPTVGGTAILSSLTAPQFTTIELGAATDTTLSRVSAGVIAVEGKTIANLSDSQTFAGVQTYAQIICTNNAITASGNAATVPVTYKTNTVTNNSAATLTITLTTSGAVDRQIVEVCVLDFSAVAQTIAWVNTENSSVTAPTTSNGSTTLPLSTIWQYNNATSKWRCIGYA